MWKFHKVTKEEKIKLLSYNKVTLGYELQCPDNVQILWLHCTSERWMSVIYTISQLGFFSQSWESWKVLSKNKNSTLQNAFGIAQTQPKGQGSRGGMSNVSKGIIVGIIWSPLNFWQLWTHSDSPLEVLKPKFLLRLVDNFYILLDIRIKKKR